MSVADFYTKMSKFYHLLFPEGFDGSISKHSEILDEIITKSWGGSIKSIIDVSCGIGTQSIGLSQRGYSVRASDLSPGAVSRAKKEAKARGLEFEIVVSDMRKVSECFDDSTDLVIAVDSAVQHLLSEDELSEAFATFYEMVNPGGGCLLSLRDYEKEQIESDVIRPYGVKEEDGHRHIIFQVWDTSSDLYKISMYFVEDSGDGNCNTMVMRSEYLPLPISRVMELLEKNGFSEVQRIDDMFFQPVIIGKKI